MQVVVTPQSGAPAPVDNRLILYMTPALKKPDVHLPYAAQWSFGGKDYHHMMAWISSEDVGNGPGGSSLTYTLLMQQALAAVPSSVGGSANLAYNMVYEEDDSKWATDEQWGWSADTVPLHNPNSPRPAGAGWETAWHCPYDFFVPRAGRWSLNHRGFSFTDYPVVLDSCSLSLPLTIRDWVLRGSEGARHVLTPDNEGSTKVRLKLFGFTVPDQFAITGIKYRLRIRREGAGTGNQGIVYEADGVASDQFGKFMLIHEWDGRANLECKLDTGLVNAHMIVPPGRYVIEWARVSCAQGLVSGDESLPILGGIVTIGAIALSEIVLKPCVFLPWIQACEVTSTLSALPLGTRMFPTDVKLWVDIYEAGSAPGSSPQVTPGHGNIASLVHTLPAGTVSPCLLHYQWTGGRNSSISQGTGVSLAVPHCVPLGRYTAVLTARPVTAGRDYHNKVSTQDVLVCDVVLEPIALNAAEFDLTWQSCEFSTVVKLVPEGVATLTCDYDVDMVVEITRREYPSFPTEGQDVSPSETVVGGRVHRLSTRYSSCKVDYRWLGNSSVVVVSDGEVELSRPLHIPGCGQYVIKVSAGPGTLPASEKRRSQAEFVVRKRGARRHLVFLDKNGRAIVDIVESKLTGESLAGLLKSRQKFFAHVLYPDLELNAKGVPAIDGSIYEAFMRGQDEWRESRGIKRMDIRGTGWEYYAVDKASCWYSSIWRVARPDDDRLHTVATHVWGDWTKILENALDSAVGIAHVVDGEKRTATVGDLVWFSGHAGIVTRIEGGDIYVGGMDGGTAGRDTCHAVWEGKIQDYPNIGFKEPVMYHFDSPPPHYEYYECP